MNILTLSELCKKIFTEIPIHVNLIYIFTTKVLNSSWGGTESFDKYPLNKMLYIDIDNCGRGQTTTHGIERKQTVI